MALFVEIEPETESEKMKCYGRIIKERGCSLLHLVLRQESMRVHLSLEGVGESAVG